MKFTKNVFAVAAAGLMAITLQVNALSIGDANYLGTINDGIPSSPADEASYINLLITLSAGATPIVLPPSGGELYDRLNSTVIGSFPTAVVAGSGKDETGGITTGQAVGYQYILGKYDAFSAGSLVWYFPNGAPASVTLPEKFNDKGLSHISWYNGTPTTVPDGGITAMLLGLALSGVAMLRRFTS
jgi:hypothetical protein